MDTNDKNAALYAAARTWTRLARQEDKGIKAGINDPVTGAYRAEVYRRTARTLLHQRKTGQVICSCCYKPTSVPCSVHGGWCQGDCGASLSKKAAA